MNILEQIFVGVCLVIVVLVNSCILYDAWTKDPPEPRAHYCVCGTTPYMTMCLSREPCPEIEDPGNRFEE